MGATLLRGLDVLELLRDRGPLKLAEITRQLGTSRATAFRVLAALQERGYVDHLRESAQYALGPGVLSLADRLRVDDLADLAYPAMLRLRDETDETINLGVVRRTQIVYHEIVSGRYAMRMAPNLGDIAPAYATAMGKAMLGCLPEDDVTRFLPSEPYPAFTTSTITTWKALKPELELTRERGYGLDSEEIEAGVMCVGAAILGPTGRPVGGLSVAALEARLSSEDIPRLGATLQRHCQSISTQLR